MADCDELTACSQRPLALGYATHVSYHTDMRNAIFLMFGLKRPSAPTKITVWRPEVGEFEGEYPLNCVGYSERIGTESWPISIQSSDSS